MHLLYVLLIESLIFPPAVMALPARANNQAAERATIARNGVASAEQSPSPQGVAEVAVTQDDAPQQSAAQSPSPQETSPPQAMAPGWQAQALEIISESEYEVSWQKTKIKGPCRDLAGAEPGQ